MMLSIAKKEHIQCRFSAFCKVVLRNAVCTYFRDLGRKHKREVSLEYLSEETHFEAHSTDDYFVRFDTPTDFTVYGQFAAVDDKCLTTALLRLSEKRQEIILLH